MMNITCNEFNLQPSRLWMRLFVRIASLRSSCAIVHESQCFRSARSHSGWLRAWPICRIMRSGLKTTKQECFFELWKVCMWWPIDVQVIPCAICLCHSAFCLGIASLRERTLPPSMHLSAPLQICQDVQRLRIYLLVQIIHEYFVGFDSCHSIACLSTGICN